MQTETPNITYIQKLAGSDIAFQNEFIDIIKNEFPEEQITYHNLLNEEKWKETADIVHKIKHKFNILSMHKAYVLGANYEMELRDGITDKQTEFEQALQQITAFLKTI
ncbi:MAG: Hpt domain-containing protein [Leeuwenhoekiella sp.]